jgi:hypothetical protein
MALSVFGPTDMLWEQRLADLILALGPTLDAAAVASLAVGIAASSRPATHQTKQADEMRMQAHLLRDIFGNPFRPVVLETTGLTLQTRTLARQIYEERRFIDLPILARAFQHEVGWADPDVRDHCHAPLPHVRGCWVIDLVLHKSDTQ